MRHMVVIVPELTGYASISHVAVSLPYAAQLIDGVKYMLPGGREAAGRRYRTTPAACAARAVNAHAGPVGPEMRQRRQLGERLKRSYDRQLQRRGLAPPGNARAEAELDRILGEP